MENRLSEFIKKYESKIIDLSKEANLAYFNASISGKSEDYEKASKLQLEISKVFGNKDDFEELKLIKESDEVKDTILLRQLTLIYNEHAGHQFEEELQEKIIKLSNKVEQKFATYRAKIDGKEYTDNEMDDLLRDSIDSAELEKFWTASKQIGAEVAEDVKELVKMRNEAAVSLGYDNYHSMSLSLSEQDPDELDKLFDELDELTGEAFEKLKNEIDEYLSERLSVSKEDLMPWHYQDKFFQQGPKIYSVDLDKYFKGEDVVKLTKEYFNGLGLEIDDLVEKSDLFEKEGKYQHAYCIDIDREGDTRVVCNVKPNYRWMSTMLHEYGHAVYEKYLSPNLPWTLKQPAHIFTTEAIAMLFGRFASNPNWLIDVVGVSEEESKEIKDDCFNTLRLEQLVLTRWVQVMYRFEREMYKNPNQDLNKLWWDLVEKYQKIKKPVDRDMPDWASKIHVALYPAYYHNYMLGELLASQLYSFISIKVLNSDNFGSFANKKDAGEYLVNLFFSYGSIVDWRELIVKATGEELTPSYYAKQFV